MGARQAVSIEDASFQWPHCTTSAPHPAYAYTDHHDCPEQAQRCRRIQTAAGAEKVAEKTWPTG